MNSRLHLRQTSLSHPHRTTFGLIPFVFKGLRTLLRHRNPQLLSFQPLPHSLPKTPGVGASLSASFSCYSPAPTLSGSLSRVNVFNDLQQSNFYVFSFQNVPTMPRLGGYTFSHFGTRPTAALGNAVACPTKQCRAAALQKEKGRSMLRPYALRSLRFTSGRRRWSGTCPASRRRRLGHGVCRG